MGKGLNSLAGALAIVAGCSGAGYNRLDTDVVRNFKNGPGVVSGIPFDEARKVCESVCRTLGPNVGIGATSPEKLDADTDSGEFVTGCADRSGEYPYPIIDGKVHWCTVPMAKGKVQTDKARLESGSPGR